MINPLIALSKIESQISKLTDSNEEKRIRFYTLVTAIVLELQAHAKCHDLNTSDIDEKLLSL